MKDKELISIVVPVYNVEKYLPYCINSIINQKYKNLEIILVDDGSTDDSGKICDEYLKKDDRIKVIHKKNGGLADARNIGIKYAKGEYIGFIDSDDCIHPDFYDCLYELLITNSADISECQFMRIDTEYIHKVKEILDDENLKIHYKISVDNNIESLKKLYGARLKPYINKVVVWNKLYKKSLFDNITFPVGKLHEDEFTTYKVLYKSNKIVSTSKILHGYMQTKNSIMRKEISPKRVDDNLKAYEEAAVFFREKNNKELECKVLRRYLENCVELSGKIFKEQSDNKEEKLIYISKIFDEYYNLYFDYIINNTFDNNEFEIIELLKNVKQDNQYNFINPIFWEKLEKIINKD